MNLINIYSENTLTFFIYYKSNTLKTSNRLLEYASVFVFSCLKSAEFRCMHRDIALFTSVISNYHCAERWNNNGRVPPRFVLYLLYIKHDQMIAWQI